jgi:hypothetical protein
MGYAKTVRPHFFRNDDCYGPDLLDELAGSFLGCGGGGRKGLEDGTGSLGRIWLAMERHV